MDTGALQNLVRVCLGHGQATSKHGRQRGAKSGDPLTCDYCLPHKAWLGQKLTHCKR